MLLTILKTLSFFFAVWFSTFALVKICGKDFMGGSIFNWFPPAFTWAIFYFLNII